MIEKPEDSTTSKEHCIAMVQSKVLKQLSILEQRKFDDEDIVEDIQVLNERLQASVQDLRYCQKNINFMYNTLSKFYFKH